MRYGVRRLKVAAPAASSPMPIARMTATSSQKRASGVGEDTTWFIALMA